MKPQNIILSALIMLILVFSACREVTVTTKINRDGSFTRIITVTGDSAEVLKRDLPFPVDAGWVLKFSKDSTDSAKYVAIYTKTFRNSNELNSEIRGDTSFYRNIKRDVTIKKRFGFFYTYLTFKEVYKSANPFTFLDYRDYVTEEDLLLTNGLKIPLTPEDSARRDNSEEKIDAFMANSAALEIESIMKQGILRLNNPLLDTSHLKVYRDSLIANLKKWDLFGQDEFYFVDVYSEISGNDAYLLLKDLDPPIFDAFNMKVKDFGNLIGFEDYLEEVEMPGLLTGTNSTMLSGNQVRWDIQVDSFLLSDFEMVAESRVINSWAFLLAGAIVFVLLVLLVVKTLRL